MSLGRAEKFTLLVVQKIVAAASLFGSTMIVSQVLRNKLNRAQLQQQIVLGMSIVDIAVSTVWLFSNLFVPPSGSEVMPFAMGNQRTCNAQGFIVQFSISAVLYNANLAIYYILVIKFRYKDWQLHKLKRWFHALPLLFGFCTALSALFLDLYNPAGWDCWIAPYPQGCQETFTADQGMEPNCIRGDNASVYQFAFFYVPLWTAIIFAVVTMATVNISVRRQENKALKWSVRPHKNSGIVMRQSLLYIASFLVTWLFPSITRVTQLITGSAPSWLVVLAGCFIPIQGALNCVVYFRPRYLRCKKQSGDPGHVVAWSIVKMALGCYTCSGVACPLRRSKSGGTDDVDAVRVGGLQFQRSVRRLSVAVKYVNDSKDIESTLHPEEMDVTAPTGTTRHDLPEAKHEFTTEVTSGEKNDAADVSSL